MSSFFLNNNAINLNSYESFRDGCLELAAIEKMPEHTFFKNDSIYNLPIINKLWENYNSPDAQEIHRFIEQLALCATTIETEETANHFCNSGKNGFLGIEFNGQAIQAHKKVVNSTTYASWIRYYQTNIELLKSFIGKFVITKNFEKSYYSLSSDAQNSIREVFEKAANRNLATRFYPDTKIIKDVSVSNKCIVLELRVYQPVALRVYFNENGETVYLASIEPKSNPNQNEDIIKAEKLLLLINSQ